VPNGGALILAAGFSRRFGSDKRRYLVDGTTPMLQRTLQVYCGVFDGVLVVIRPEDDDLVVSLPAGFPGLQTIVAEDAALGMGHSLAAGARAIPADWQFVAVALGDMPWIRPETVELLVAEFPEDRPDAIVQPVYGDVPGHPVLFGSGCFEALSSLTGDQGARDLLAERRGSLIRVVVDDEGVLGDLDTPP
jgi:molybdenum cofactor cytidylyltransferase